MLHELRDAPLVSFVPTVLFRSHAEDDDPVSLSSYLVDDVRLVRTSNDRIAALRNLFEIADLAVRRKLDCHPD